MPEDFGFFRRHQENRRLDTIARLVPKKNVKRVLDAGTAHGWLAEKLAVRGFDVDGLDLGMDSIRRAAKRLDSRGIPVRFVRGDVYRLPYREKAFDAVIASEIIEHLDRPGEALAEFARVIRPGGYLILSLPWRERIEYTLCIHCNQKTPVNAHLFSFDEKIVSGLVREAGFVPERIFGFMHRPAERLGFAGFTGFSPHGFWRMADRLFCAVAGHQSCMAVRAIRHG